MISVIVPCYNARKTINRLLKSIPEDWETIIVEDGSDEPIDVPDLNGIYIKQDNAGPGAARNTGLKHATGEYVLFADADDEIIPFDWQPYLNHDIVYSYFLDNINGDDTLKYTKSFGCIYGVAYRRKFLEDNNITFPGWIQREDIVFNTVCQALSDDWATLCAETYRRYVTVGSITQSRDFNRTEIPYLVKEINYLWELFKGSDLAKKLCTRTFCYLYWLCNYYNTTPTDKVTLELVDLEKYLEKNKEAAEKRLGSIEQIITMEDFINGMVRI